MGRNETCKAIVLRTYRIGEIHVGVTLFTEVNGLVQAIAHGANSRNGKLRGLTNPFCYGTVYLYNDPVKKSTKVSDFDVQDFFIGLRESVRRYYTASLWSEVVLKSFGGGESAPPLFALFVSALKLLDTASEPVAGRLSAQFLARYLSMVGHLPDTAECGNCGRSLAGSVGESRAFYSATQELFLCERCAGPDMLSIPVKSMVYLDSTLGCDTISAALAAEPDAGVVEPLLNLLYALVAALVETPLSTLEIGRGIL
ncbi:MAG TPA: DNA repair protein RecO [Spirochaetia bacterium]|nr:DNA repair protein RecO [Spirochaetia bacterium]